MISEQPDSLFKPSVLSVVRPFRKSWLINLKIESIQSLDASDGL